jgi:hypothetical protein
MAASSPAALRPAAVNPLAGALSRLTTPGAYLAFLGGLQVGLVFLLRGHFGIWLPLVSGVLLIGLLLLLIRRPAAWGRKLLLLLLLVTLTTVGPALVSLLQRPEVGLTIEHDGLVQIEAAIDRVIAGQPIYGIDWTGTDLALIPWGLASGPNPALHHFAYFPLTVLLGVPVRLMTRALGLPFDYRLVLIAFVPVGLLAIAGLQLPAPRRFMAMVAVFLSPLISLYFWSGRNDVCFVAMLLVGLALLANDRPVLASGAFGIALALKPFALFALPFLVLALWIRSGRSLAGLGSNASLLVGCAAAWLAAPVLSIVPFLMADPAAFWRDTVLYTSGGVPDAYPISGLGFSAVLLSLHIVTRAIDSFPFLLFQLAAMAPVLWFAGRALLRRPTLGRWVFAYTGLFAAFAFFSRFFNDSYAGVVIALILLALAFGDTPLFDSEHRQPAAWR